MVGERGSRRKVRDMGSWRLWLLSMGLTCGDMRAGLRESGWLPATPRDLQDSPAPKRLPAGSEPGFCLLHGAQGVPGSLDFDLSPAPASDRAR